MFKIHRDNLHRIAYATDASVYREVPYGVAYPENEDQIASLIEFAESHKLDLIPRAGGTSIAGQVVGSGVVCDISKHLNKILEINPTQRWARVQPGVVRDELNLALKQYGLFFSPETSTSNRCCIGGMMGNNSCGTHSLIYGSTRDHIISAKGILSDGTQEEFRDFTIAELEERFGERFWEKQIAADMQGCVGKEKETGGVSLIERIYSQLIGFAIDGRTRSVIVDNYPDAELRRRSCGYAIDEVIEDLIRLPDVCLGANGGCDYGNFRKRRINLCKLICGGEGTLVFITEITVSLDPLPKPEVMVVCAHCNSLQNSFEANLVALSHNPEAVELMDADILELSRSNSEQARNSFFVEGTPAALLMIELRGDTRKEIDDKADALEKSLTDSGLVYFNTRVYGSDVSKVWNLRKAGLGVLSGMKGDAKPVGVVEDTAVAPRYLPAYLADFRQMADRLGMKCVFYGHISTGELHLRPILNLKTAGGREKFREIAYQSALLVKKHRGSLSGEHGDGRLRGEFIRLLYGDECYELMRQVKNCWDPSGVFNRHKIVDTLPMDSCLRYGENQQYAIEHQLGGRNTYFNWKADFDECKVEGATGAPSQIRALMCTVEQCNGAGDCRKSNLIGGTLCPAFKVSSDETKATRSRANILREILTRGWESEVFSSSSGAKGDIFDIPEIKEVLDSCLACKGCRSECPSNVDMTRLRAEILQHIYDAKGTPFRSYMVARMASVERLGHNLRPLYNFFASNRFTERLIKKVLKFSAQRHIPALSRHTMRKLVQRELKSHGGGNKGSKVYLFADEFTNFQEAELGLTFARLLIRLGYEVEIPNHKESGRAAISKGCLKLARKFAVRNLELLSDIVSPDTPLVGIEPSCILSFRDEYPDLVEPSMRDTARALGKSCLLYDEFLFSEIEKGNILPEQFADDECDIHLHGHCHQKALVGIQKTERMLSALLKGAAIHTIPSGCCGMAGSFGYEKEHYSTSMAIGEMVLFPAVRKAVSGDSQCFVAAPGTSCRQQIADGTGIKAYHPIELLYKFLKA